MNGDVDPQRSATFGAVDIKHPFAQYTLSQAVALAKQTAMLRDDPAVTSLSEAREAIQGAVKRSDHHWITGYAALDVLDAAIDGRDLSKDCRLI